MPQVFAIAAVLFSTGPASAAVFFHVTQTGPVTFTDGTVTAPVNAEVRARIALREDRLAEGYDVTVSHSTYGEPGGINLRQLGIDNFHVEIVRIDGFKRAKVFEVLITDFIHTRSALFDLSIQSIPDGVPDIFFSWQDQDREQGIAFGSIGGVVSGDIAGIFPFGPDFGGAPVFTDGCYINGACTFSGLLTTGSDVVAVPSPAPMGMLLLGIGSLAALRRTGPRR
jgi:hypothetical protein